MTDSHVVTEIVDFEDLTNIKYDHHLVTAISILIFAFSVQWMVFPVYIELEKRSTERFWQVSLISTNINCITFIAIAIIGVLLFGCNIYSDFLYSISSRPGKVSIFIRSSYCFLLFFHIPYFFFSIKEYTLVMIDEWMNRSLSIHLEQKISDCYKKNDEKAEGN